MCRRKKLGPPQIVRTVLHLNWCMDIWMDASVRKKTLVTLPDIYCRLFNCSQEEKVYAFFTARKNGVKVKNWSNFLNLVGQT